jgi:hypothetical protein
MRFLVENYEDVIAEMRLLHPAHWEEVGIEEPLSMDYVKYDELAKGGAFILVTAREKNKLVGYHLVIVSKSLRQKDKLCGFTDIFYLSTDFRKGFNGIRFLKFTMGVLRDAGVYRFLTTATTRNPFYRILERLGFVELERVFTKVL